MGDVICNVSFVNVYVSANDPSEVGPEFGGVLWIDGTFAVRNPTDNTVTVGKLDASGEFFPSHSAVVDSIPILVGGRRYHLTFHEWPKWSLYFDPQRGRYYELERVRNELEIAEMVSAFFGAWLTMTRFAPADGDMRLEEL